MAMDSEVHTADTRVYMLFGWGTGCIQEIGGKPFAIQEHE
jgi:hypothetical protein